MQDLLPEVLFGWQHLLSVWQPLAQERCDSQQALFVPEDQNKHYLITLSQCCFFLTKKHKLICCGGGCMVNPF
jgi:hypothetical protein